MHREYEMLDWIKKALGSLATSRYLRSFGVTQS